MWMSLVFGAFVLSILCAGGVGFCAALWHGRPALWAMLRPMVLRQRPRSAPSPAPMPPPIPASLPLPHGIVALYASLRQWRVRRYLRRDPALVLDVLRQSPTTAALAVRTLYELESKGEMPPRRETAQYPQLAFAGAVRPLQRSLPKMAPAALRQFSATPPARRALNSIESPILDTPWAIGLRRPLGKKMHETIPEPTDEQHARILAATNMLLMPNNEMTWREFLEPVLEDLLTFGAGPFEVQENPSDERPLFLWPVEAQSIRINTGWQPGSRHEHYAQARNYVWSAIGTTDDIPLEDDELCYPRLNPRTNTPFGLGYLEVAFEAVNAFLGAMDYAARRASNATPLFGIFLGENVTIDQVRVWQHYWENEIEGYGKVPILGGGRQPSVFSMQGNGDDALFLKWQEWLVRIVAMAFGLSPMRLGIERDVNRSTASVQSAEDWATIAPVANTVRDVLTHWVLWKKLGWRDLEFAWQVRTADELKQAEILAEQYAMNGITVDEIRQVYERAPLPDGIGQFTKAQYEAIFKTAAAPHGGAVEDDATLVTPFDDAVQTDTLKPDEAAFVRAFMREKRHERHGLAAVAT